MKTESAFLVSSSPRKLMPSSSFKPRPTKVTSFNFSNLLRYVTIRGIQDLNRSAPTTACQLIAFLTVWAALFFLDFALLNQTLIVLSARFQRYRVAFTEVYQDLLNWLVGCLVFNLLFQFLDFFVGVFFSHA